MKFLNILLILLNLIFLIRGNIIRKNMMSYKIEPLKHSTAVIGEGPHWDISTKSLYFVDIQCTKIYRYDYNEDKTYETKIENENHASFIIPIEDKPNQFAVGLDRQVGIIEWDGKSPNSKCICILFEVEKNDDKAKDNRFNDAKVDPKGRFFGGTMSIFVNPDVSKVVKTGNLYRYDNKTNTPILLKDNIGISNGLTWNSDKKKFYYIDSVALNVQEYDYNIETGEIKNPKTLVDFRVKENEKQNFVPDGMTIDTNGNLYVATFGGSKIFKVNPNGKIEMEIKMPCEQITSVAFGGPNLDILYVTTASENGKPSPAGQTFQITGLGVKGLPMHKLKL